MKQPLLSLRPLSVLLLLSLIFLFHSVNSLDKSFDLDPSECGITDIEPKVDSRVVGGVEATPHFWPWQVSIRLRYDGWKHYCFGSLLNSNWVITTAHCFDLGIRPGDYKIVLGEHNRGDYEGTEQGFKPDKIIVHEYFHDTTRDNNIALIHLKEHVRFNRSIKPICLPDYDDDYNRKLCVATGWENTTFTVYENVKNQFYLPVGGNKKCNESDWYGGLVTETDNMICAGEKSGCSGDSGGPLACLSDGKWTLFGMTSWGGNTCGPIEHKRPILYVRVMMYINWIRRKTEQYDHRSYD